MQFNKHRWRAKEPSEPYPDEQTILYKQLVYRALGESYKRESKAAELLGMTLSSFYE